ncbi:MAG: gliding motility-associated C-terminal domain-containing protein, partial [Flavobacteriales bacterium]|nr:gliding motility-associated C-terminal domain-containing protein [Flavobacteriales bacterium]
TAGNLGAGPLLITVTDANGCTDNSFTTIDEPDTLILFISPDVSLCYGESTIIDATAGGGVFPYVYMWDNGLSSNQIQTVSPLVTTTYSVFVEDANGCTSAADQVTVNVSPQLSLSTPDMSICVGADVTFGVAVTGGNGGPYGYLWSNGVTDSVQTISGLVSDTSFSVTVSDGCSPDSTDTVHITVNPVPDVTFIVEGKGCEPFVLTAEVATQGGQPPVPITSWFWDFGDGSTSTDAESTTHVYTVADTFDVSLIVVSDQGCSDTIVQPAAAIAFAAPMADFVITQNGKEVDPAVTSILSPTFDFVDSSSMNVTTWAWDFGEPSTGADNVSDLENPSHMYMDTGTYTITLIVSTPDGCSDTISKEVTITGQFILFTPNAFSPNGDGKNDFFFPQGVGVDNESFELFIFDRWGDLIATVTGVWSADIGIGWNGHANEGGEAAQQDVYVWLIRTSDILGDEHEYIGHVTLLK